MTMNITEAHTLIDNYFHAVRNSDILDVRKAYTALFNALLGIHTNPQPKEAPMRQWKKCALHQTMNEGACPQCQADMDKAIGRSLSRQKYRYFFYALCTEDQVTALIKSAEDKGCEFVTLLSGMVPAPKANLTLHAPKGPEYIPVLRIFVRCREEEWPEISKAMEADFKAMEASHKRPEGGLH